MSHSRTLSELACPPIQIFARDIEDLYVTQDPLAVHPLEVKVLNVEVDLDLLPSIKFLVHNTGRRLSQLEGRLVGNGCSLEQKFLKKEIRRWYEGGKGTFAWRVGNILQAFRCVSSVAPIMEMDLFYVKIHVWVDRSMQFEVVENLVLKFHGKQEPCSEVLSLTVRAVISWVKINWRVTAIKLRLWPDTRRERYQKLWFLNYILVMC